MARLQVDIGEELKTQLKICAVKKNQTMGELVTEALTKYLAENDAKK